MSLAITTKQANDDLLAVRLEPITLAAVRNNKMKFTALLPDSNPSKVAAMQLRLF